ncbi:hypothetical protein ACA910_011091 [Epithemia clementina (nom. ined.)]
MAQGGSRRNRCRVRWSVLPRLATGTLGWPMMIVVVMLFATASRLAAAAAEEEEAWYPLPPPPLLHLQKMVADKTWIQSYQRLSNKGLPPQPPRHDNNNDGQAMPIQTTIQS